MSAGKHTSPSQGARAGGANEKTDDWFPTTCLRISATVLEALGGSVTFVSFAFGSEAMLAVAVVSMHAVNVFPTIKTVVPVSEAALVTSISYSLQVLS